LARAYAAVANGHGNQQQPSQAIGTMLEASKRLPNNAFLDDMFFQLAGLYFTAGDYGNAAEAYLQYLATYPAGRSIAEAKFLYGMSLYSSGQADRAIEQLRSFVAKHDTSDRVPEALLQIGEAYFNTNRFAESAESYARVYQRYPKNDNAPLAMLNEGWSYFQAGEPKKMIEVFDRLAVRYPESPLAADAAFSVGDYFYNNKSYDSALVAYQQFVDRFPEHARTDEAKQLIRELGQVEAYKAYEAAMEFFDAKNWKVAIEELTKVMEKFPQTDVVYGCKANIASAHAQLGQRSRALKMFDEIITEWKDIEAARPAVFFSELHKRWIEAGR
jgi:outer membrane protein assembly factor BamD